MQLLIIEVKKTAKTCYLGNTDQASQCLPRISCSATERDVLAANARRIVLTWNGVTSGCFPIILTTIPVICGAAKLFPLIVVHCWLSQGTRTLIPGAPNSTGGSGL